MRARFATAAIALAAVVGGAVLADPQLPVVPRGLPPVKVPAHNPHTAEKVELGKQLYFDTRLSRDNTVSCATCHDPAKGWSNDDKTAEGVGGKRGNRSSPTVLNTAYQEFQFWDGRAGSLEEQALGPVQNPVEMNLTLPEMVEKLNQIEGYRTQFKTVFDSEITAENVGKAIAAFERTIISGDAPYDRFLAGDKQALSPAAQRGLKLFTGKAHCSACHSGKNFTDNAFHNLGIGMAAKDPDPGRHAVSKLLGDRGAFKTPTLREIKRTAPYMHDGSLATLEDVIDYYNRGGFPNPQLDEEIFDLGLSVQEKADLVTFLKEGLSSESYPNIAPPKLP